MRFRIFSILSLLISLSSLVQGQNAAPTDRAQQFIDRARERLGDNLATTAEQVIEQHVRAVGGREALQAINTIKIEGRNIILSPEERALVRYSRQPEGLYQSAPGGSSYVLSDGNAVYQVNGDQKTELQRRWTPPLKHYRIDGNFVDYEQRGIECTLVGLDAFPTEPSVFYHVRRIFPDGYHEDLFFDVDSGLLRMVMENGDTSYRRAFYEYREVDGVLFPHMRMTVFDGLVPPHVFVVDRIETNIAIPDALNE